LGRAVVFLVANTIFALVYLKARKFRQEQALNKLWINIWHVGVASNMGVVAVYALNDEFKSILREAKNGMTAPMTYVLAKTILVIPIMLIFAIVALGIPSILIMDFPGDKFGAAILLWSSVMYVFECAAECFSVWLSDPILGMMAYTAYWFGFFLFSGFLISVDDLVYPFKIFYYIFPFSYYIRSQLYNLLIDTTWVPCDPTNNVLNSAVCEPSPTGAKILQAIGLSFPVIQAKDTFWQDFGTLIALAVVFKIAYVIGVYRSTSKVTTFHASAEYRPTKKPVQPVRTSTSDNTATNPLAHQQSEKTLPPGALEILSSDMARQLQDRVGKFNEYLRVEL
jgi:ABC-2 type transporter